MTTTTADALADAIQAERRPRYQGEIGSAELRTASEFFWRMMVTADRRAVNKQRGALRLLRRWK